MGLKDDKERISVYLNKDLKRWLAQQAKQNNRSMSNYISATLEQIRENQDEEEPVDLIVNTNLQNQAQITK